MSNKLTAGEFIPCQIREMNWRQYKLWKNPIPEKRVNERRPMGERKQEWIKQMLTNQEIK